MIKYSEGIPSEPLQDLHHLMLYSHLEKEILMCLRPHLSFHSSHKSVSQKKIHNKKQLNHETTGNEKSLPCKAMSQDFRTEVEKTSMQPTNLENLLFEKQGVKSTMPTGAKRLASI